jgi:hypothetical protein
MVVIPSVEGRNLRLRGREAKPRAVHGLQRPVRGASLATDESPNP